MSDDTRELSCFFCRELFSLHLEGALDRGRQQSVEEHVAKCASCAAVFENVKNSRKTVIELSKTKPNDALVSYLKREHHFWTDFFENLGWRRWPSALKWSFELTALAAVLALTIHFFPWLNLVKSLRRMRARTVVRVAMEDGPAAKALPETLDTDGIEHAVGAGPEGLAPGEPAQDEAGPADSHPAEAAAPKVPKVPKAPETPKGAAVTVVAANEAPSPSPAGSQDASDEPDDDSGNTAAAAAPAASPGGPETSPTPHETGYVWKGTLKVDEVTDDLAAKVTKTIERLGGVKAGHVELGWHRGDQRYYHFILPEENYEKLLRDLNEVGIVELTKQPHPRVIKEGHMRIIMTMEESE